MGGLIAGLFVCIGSVWIHELAHALAARFRGCQVTALVVGQGPILWQGSLGALTVELRALPFSGSTRIRWRNAATRVADIRTVTAAGPAANLLMVLLALPAAETILGDLVILANLGCVIGSLGLAEAVLEGGPRVSDASRLRQLLGVSRAARNWDQRWVSFQSPDIRSVVEGARDVAASRGVAEITVEDLLVGLVADESGSAGVVLRGAGLTRDSALAALGDVPASSGKPRKLGPSREARRMLQLALAQTTAPAVPMLSSLHLLLAFTLSADPRCSRMLIAHGVDEGVVREALADWIRFSRRYDQALRSLAAGDYPSCERELSRLANWRLLPRESRASILNHHAWSILMGDPSRAGDALEHSSRALALAPNTATFMETHAYALIESGRITEGVELNNQVLQLSSAPRSQVTHDCISAIGLLRLGRIDDAAALVGSARRRQVDSEILDRAERELSTARVDRPPTASRSSPS